MLQPILFIKQMFTKNLNKGEFKISVDEWNLAACLQLTLLRIRAQRLLQVFVVRINYILSISIVSCDSRSKLPVVLHKFICILFTAQYYT